MHFVRNTMIILLFLALIWLVLDPRTFFVFLINVVDYLVVQSQHSSFLSCFRSCSNTTHSCFISADKKVVVELTPKPRRSLIGLMFKLLLLLLLGLAGVAATCRLTDLQKETVCVPVNIFVDDSLSWAKEQEGVVRQLVQNLSSAAKEFLESTQTSKN